MARHRQASVSTAKCKECGLELKANSLASHEKACNKKTQAKKRERELEDVIMGQASKQGNV